MATVQENKTNISTDIKSRNPIIQFDKLQMYFGEPYVIDLDNIDGSITIKQPTIMDIIKFGEKRFYSNINFIVCNTTSYRLMLWENGIDWNTMKDFELFILLYKQIDKEIADLLFNVDLQEFVPYEKQVDEDTKELVLYNAKDKIEINEQVYYHISQYFRNVFNIFPEEKLTNDNALKELYIYKEKSQLKNTKIKEDKGEFNDSSIVNVISACVNHPGFKYTTKELKDLHVYEFFDSVKRLQVYEQTTALMKGMYSGMMDASKIKSEDYNFMKNI